MGILRWQKRIAVFLNHKTQYWNSTSKIIALTAFILLFGGLSLYFLIKAL